MQTLRRMDGHRRMGWMAMVLPDVRRYRKAGDATGDQTARKRICHGNFEGGGVKLSAKAKRMKWNTWKLNGGCDLPEGAFVRIPRFDDREVTLGALAAACPKTKDAIIQDCIETFWAGMVEG